MISEAFGMRMRRFLTILTDFDIFAISDNLCHRRTLRQALIGYHRLS